MEKYFDAFLYLANWGTHVLKLRLPSRLLDPSTAKNYCGGRSASVKEKADKVILSFLSDDERDGEWVEGEGELLISDLRARRTGARRPPGAVPGLASAVAEPRTGR
jgi:hypothetical protein